MMTRRKYEQRLRAEAAEETRRHILDALYERLRAAPAERISVDQIARAARVSRSTVYLIFGSRSGLFDALGLDLLHRGGFERMVRNVLQPDARKGLREGIRDNVAMYAAHRDVLRALYSMASLDAEAVGGAVHRLEQGRAAGMDDLARRLAEQGALHEDITTEDAAGMLFVFSGFDTFDLLYTGRSLSAEKVAEGLAAATERALCPPVGEPAP